MDMVFPLCVIARVIQELFREDWRAKEVQLEVVYSEGLSIKVKSLAFPSNPKLLSDMVIVG